MILVNKDIEQKFDFAENQVHLLCVENSNEYYSLTKQIIAESGRGNGYWVLSEDNNILDIQDNLLCLYDFYGISFKNKKIDNLLNNEINEIIRDNDYFYDFSEINTKITMLADKIKEKLDFNVDYSCDVGYENIVKLMSFEMNEEQDLVSEIVGYVDVFAKLKNIKLVVFVSLFQLLSKQDIELLMKDLRYKEVNILFIEPNKKYLIDNVKTTIIDDDLCEI